jgi:uncharacterized cupredoxin-like copper-binding protein
MPGVKRGAPRGDAADLPHHGGMPPRPRAVVLTTLVALLATACGGGDVPATPPITPGASATPRDVNIVMRDYSYVPSAVDLVPGETVTFRVLNGGLEIHEAVLGDIETQMAWEDAEAATVGHPPGPTPLVPEPSGFDGVRIVVESGKRLDVTWTVPPDAAAAPGGWFVGCHIPGHWAKGMVVPVRFVGPGGAPLGTPALPSASAGG